MTFATFSAAQSFYEDDSENAGQCGDELTWHYDAAQTAIVVEGSGSMYNFSSRVSSGSGGMSKAELSQMTARQRKKAIKKNLQARAKQRRKSGGSASSNYAVPWYHLKDVVTRVILPEGLTSIGDNAFKGFRELKKVALPSDVQYIGKEAFYWCESLDTIRIPDADTLICENAFSGCIRMRYVELGSGIKEIEGGAFYQCQALRGANYRGTMSDWFVVSLEGENSNPVKYAGRMTIQGEPVEEVVVPDTIVAVPSYSFIGLTTLRTVRMHENVVEIGDQAFNGCRALQTIYAKPAEPPVLGRFVFLNTALRDVYISDETFSVGYKAIWGSRYNYLTP